MWLIRKFRICENNPRRRGWERKQEMKRRTSTHNGAKAVCAGQRAGQQLRANQKLDGYFQYVTVPCHCKNPYLPCKISCLMSSTNFHEWVGISVCLRWWDSGERLRFRYESTWTRRAEREPQNRNTGVKSQGRWLKKIITPRESADITRCPQHTQLVVLAHLI